MGAAVVFESMLGNTRQVAEAVASGIRAARPDVDVTCTPACSPPPDAARAELLVVGAPTYVRRLPGPRGRQGYLQGRAKSEQAGKPLPALDVTAGGPGVQEWLAVLPTATPGQTAAAFDTRLASPFAGSAARRIARRLRRKSFPLAVPPQGFVVTGGEGPLRDGELERANAWGTALAERVMS